MTQEQIAALKDFALDITAPLQQTLLQDICRRIAKAGKITSTAEYQIYRAEALGLSEQVIKQAIEAQLGVTGKKVNRMFTYVADKSARFEDNGGLQQMVGAYAEMTARSTNGMLENLWMPAPDGQLYTIKDAYAKTIDFAFGQVFTGTLDYTTAMRRATAELVKRGIRTIPRKNGSSVGIEYATRSYLMNRLGEMDAIIQQMNYDYLDCNGWEISAHAACALDHEDIQGRQYPDKDYKALNERLARPIGKFNCAHYAMPIILGVDSPQYSAQQLQQMKDDNAKGIFFDGHHYTMYEATQKQAELESHLRAFKTKILVDDTLADAEKLQKDQIRMRVVRQTYTRFCKEAGLPTRPERLQVAGWGHKEASIATNAVKKAKVSPDVLQKLKFADDVPITQRVEVEDELKVLPTKIKEIAETQIQQVRVLPKDNPFVGGYNPEKKEILLQESFEPGTVVHEYAHALEQALSIYSDPAFLEVQRKGLENLTPHDILEDTTTFSQNIWYVKSDKLVSPYQGRLYDSFGIYDGKHVSLKGMREYFSEGLRAYYFETEKLKKRDPDLFRYIEELMK